MTNMDAINLKLEFESQIDEQFDRIQRAPRLEPIVEKMNRDKANFIFLDNEKADWDAEKVKVDSVKQWVRSENHAFDKNKI
jgi:hypothetical protein